MVGKPEVGICYLNRTPPARLQSFWVNVSAHRGENGCQQDERAVSRTIYAAAGLTTRKRRESVSGRRKRFEAM
jgi:hypothetical protein